MKRQGTLKMPNNSPSIMEAPTRNSHAFQPPSTRGCLISWASAIFSKALSVKEELIADTAMGLGLFSFELSVSEDAFTET
jgi:hypothetical protein